MLFLLPHLQVCSTPEESAKSLRRNPSRNFKIWAEDHITCMSVIVWSSCVCLSFIRFSFIHLQITVSSGGMLVQKLNISDLQSGNGTFDGVMVYAQNKVQSMG